MTHKFRTGLRSEADEREERDRRGLVATPDNNWVVNIPPAIRAIVQEYLFVKMDLERARLIPRQDLVAQLEVLVSEIANDRRLQLSQPEQRTLATQFANDMRGIGPLEVFMDDDAITDVMVNGPEDVFVERNGKIVRTGVKFRDEEHVRDIAKRIAGGIGRSLDEASPVVDARLPDGSRVNIVIPPIALRGTCISIRLFPKQAMTLADLVARDALSDPMRQFLEHAARSRLNILISGSTSSGKTTLLNALSRHISENERIVTIEDAAELKLQQAHVLPFETRPKSLTSQAPEIAMRDLLKNALRQRPDRIIIGEVRGPEAFDLMQAMNTGHEGSMSTLHANNPRDALARLENMILMAGFEQLPMKAIRAQIASAIDIVIQVERMHDGVRRITRITEITDLEDDTVKMSDLFKFEQRDLRQGVIIGDFASSHVTLRCMPKLERFGLANEARRALLGDIA